MTRSQRVQRRTIAHVNDLMDLARTKPAFTIADVENDLGWTHALATRTVRKVRLSQADEAETLPCIPQGRRQPWLYQLTDEDEPVEQWVTIRLKDLEHRIQTAYSMVSSKAKAAKTPEAMRKAQRVARDLGRVIDDIADLRAEAV